MRSMPMQAKSALHVATFDPTSVGDMAGIVLQPDDRLCGHVYMPERAQARGGEQQQRAD